MVCFLFEILPSFIPCSVRFILPLFFPESIVYSHLTIPNREKQAFGCQRGAYKNSGRMPPCLLPSACVPQPCKVPYRGRFHSDKHAAVLSLQKTQPKDRRAYNSPYRNPCRAAAHRRTAGDTAACARNFYMHPLPKNTIVLLYICPAGCLSADGKDWKSNVHRKTAGGKRFP